MHDQIWDSGVSIFLLPSLKRRQNSRKATFQQNLGQWKVYNLIRVNSVTEGKGLPTQPHIIYHSLFSVKEKGHSHFICVSLPPSSFSASTRVT